ncbi:helix-turn-helix domain-containing protein [Archangium violaceum]|uniref:helix-turn-helix domain-containing protein n=1 Tax=Archangium violaceum TaxID=83451 RepID=UPI0036D9F4A2
MAETSVPGEVATVVGECTLEARRGRRRRFEIARQRLLAGAPGTTVAGVVASLGFVSGGRFSVEYKKLFDESPSDTLAASRGSAGPTTKRSPRAR